MLGVLRIIAGLGGRALGRAPRPAPRPRPGPARGQAPKPRRQRADGGRSTRVAVGDTDVHVSTGPGGPSPRRPERRPAAGAGGTAPARPGSRASAAAVVVPGAAAGAGAGADEHRPRRTGREEAAPPGRRGGRRRSRRVLPWQVPADGAASTGRIVVRPAFLQELQRVLTGHLATTDEVDRTARRHVGDLDVGGLVVAGHLEQRIRRRAGEAVEDHAGTRRLPPLLARDLGYVIDALARAERMDAADAFGPRAVAGLMATLAPGTSRTTRSRLRRWLTDLEPPRRLPTTPRGGTDDRPRPGDALTGGAVFAATRDRAAPADASAVLAGRVVPFLAGRGLVAVPLEAGGTGQHAVGCAAADGEATARALATELGISRWRANSYQAFATELGGARYAVQVLWGADIGHGDRVAVRCRPA